MTPLRELQAAFRRSILDGEDGAIAPLVLGAGLAAEQRLRVYRNNTLTSLSAALETTFPVVARLVGADFFRGAARAYVRADPPTAPCLAEYGRNFADFLAQFPAARPLPYLRDVARLEWALNESQNAAMSAPLDLQAVAARPQAEYPALRFVPHPASRLIESRFPIDRIWTANQPGNDGDEVIDASSGGCYLLVCRDSQGGAAFHSVTPAEFRFVETLRLGESLAEAYQLAAAAQPDFAPTGILHRLLHCGFFAAVA